MGGDHVVDTSQRMEQSLGLGPSSVPLVYLGRYTAHENKRVGWCLAEDHPELSKASLYGTRTLATIARIGAIFYTPARGPGRTTRSSIPIVINEWYKARVPGSERAWLGGTARSLDLRVHDGLGGRTTCSRIAKPATIRRASSTDLS